MRVADFKTFGETILEARKHKELSLKECASLIRKEDGTPVSFQYLSEIEIGRRNPPPEYIIIQLADVLDIPIEILYFHSKTIPSDVDYSLSKDTIVSAYRDLIRIIKNKKVA